MRVHVTTTCRRRREDGVDLQGPVATFRMRVCSDVRFVVAWASSEVVDGLHVHEVLLVVRHILEQADHVEAVVLKRIDKA